MKTLEDLREQYGTEEIWAWPEAHPQLFDLVADGSKRATSAYFARYEKEQRPLPTVGVYHILVDRLKDPMRAVVLQWTEVRLFPFDQVADDVPVAEHLSKEQWCKAYQQLFTKDAEQLGRRFSTDDRVATRFFIVIEVADLGQ